MNREIKFRLWDADNKVFDYIDFNDLDKTCQTIGTYESYFSYAYFEGNNFLQQFTCAKAKNGTDIYEGDIVKVKGMKRTGDYTTTVIWKNQGFTLKENKTYFVENRCLIAVLEVIGNVHQNPDLL